MAGETRRQRRDARRAAGEDTGRGGTARAVPVGPQGTPEPTVDHGRRGGFIRESIGELKKVEWPNQNQLMQGTVVVLVACAIAGVYLWLNDQLWKPVVERLILGQ